MTSNALRIAERRRSLIESGTRLIAERGFHSVSIEEICAASGITGPGLYRHFRDKQDLLAHIVGGVVLRLLSEARNVVSKGGAPEDLFRGLVDAHLDVVLSEADALALLVYFQDQRSMRPQDRRVLRQQMRKYIEEWVGVIRRIHPKWSAEGARTAAHAVIWMLNSGSGDASREILRGMAISATLPSP
jgi:AcrR family transcriptional regulator